MLACRRVGTAYHHGRDARGPREGPCAGLPVSSSRPEYPERAATRRGQAKGDLTVHRHSAATPPGAFSVRRGGTCWVWGRGQTRRCTGCGCLAPPLSGPPAELPWCGGTPPASREDLLSPRGRVSRVGRSSSALDWNVPAPLSRGSDHAPGRIEKELCVAGASLCAL